MTTDFNLQFIRHKLTPIKNAVMYSTGNQAIKLTNDIVMLLKVDDEGQFWFAAHQPRYWIKNYEQCFPVRLFFYQKGTGFFIEATGNAMVAFNEEVALYKDEMNPGMILLKMIPSRIEYTKTSTRRFLPGFTKWYSNVCNWLIERFSIPTFSRNRFPGLSRQKVS